MDPSHCLLSLSVDILWVSSHKYMESSISKTKLLIYLLKSIPSPGPLQCNVGMCIHLVQLSGIWVWPESPLNLTSNSQPSLTILFLKYISNPLTSLYTITLLVQAKPPS